MHNMPGGWRGYLGANVVTYEVDTLGGPHKVSWRAGRLTLHNHSIRAEEVLRGVGGDPCPCLLVFDALTNRQGGWASGSEDRVQVQQILSKLADDPLFPYLSESNRAVMMHRTKRRLALQCLPPEMAAIVEQASSLRRRHRHRPGTTETANRSLRGIATPILINAVRGANEHLWSYAPIVAECWKQPAGGSVLVYGRMSQTQALVVVALRSAWINLVWRRGLAVVDGHFILDVSGPPSGDRLLASALAWESPDQKTWTATTMDRAIRRSEYGWVTES